MHERSLSTSPFPDDDGTARPPTRAALAAADGTVPGYLRAVAALGGERLLAPVVATATRGGQTVGGLTTDKEAEMAVVFLQAADGRRAAVCFTGLDALQQWQPDARPVPVTLDLMAATTLREGAVALLVDPAGPASLVIEQEILTELAAGRRLVALDDGGFGWLAAAPD